MSNQRILAALQSTGASRLIRKSNTQQISFEPPPAKNFGLSRQISIVGIGDEYFGASFFQEFRLSKLGQSGTHL